MGQAKNRGTLEQRIAQAKQRREDETMPSFIVRLKVNKDLDLVYDNTGLESKQIKFVDTCINQLQSELQSKIKNPDRVFGCVFWGRPDDFAGTMFEPQEDVDLEALWTEKKDLFFAQYWGSTNQHIELSETYCDAVTSNTNYVPIGASLNSVEKHTYTNFAVAVAYTRQSARMMKPGGVSFGDMAPPEVVPGNKWYHPDFASKVQQALGNFGIKVECDWKPGAMMTTLVEA